MEAIDFRTAGATDTGFHVMAKPSGPACNLDCDYCFYLEKDTLFEPRKRRRMSDEVLDAYVRNTIASTPQSQPVLFAWQGGEPALMGLVSSAGPCACSASTVPAGWSKTPFRPTARSSRMSGPDSWPKITSWSVLAWTGPNTSMTVTVATAPGQALTRK